MSVQPGAPLRLLSTIGPFNIGLLMRAARELFGSVLLLGGLTFGLSYLMGYAFPRIQERILERGGPTRAMLQFRQAFLGDDAAMALPGQIAAGIQWSHPVLLALVFAQIIVSATRVPPAETERGTIDVLLGLPVSRWQIYCSETLALVTSALVMLLAACAGAYFARASVNPKVLVDWASVQNVLANLACLQVAVIGVVCLLSSLSERRGRAVLAAVSLVLAWIIGEFLGGLWEPARRVEWLSLLHYYKPLAVVRADDLPWVHMLTLLGVGTVTWVAGGVVLSRRALTSV
jgi:putative exporter of polyketide antibiotics